MKTADRKPCILRTAIRITVLLLTLTLALILQPFPAARAETAPKVVRVGWHDAPFCIADANGRRSGYAYEYQLKVAAYTGWTYEYVEGSWLELMDKLEKGEIDLMSDVSLTEERKEKMLFSTLPMGTEAYFVVTAPDNEEIIPAKFETLNGKRIGITKGSYQQELFTEWVALHGVNPEIVEMTSSELETLEKMKRGELDAAVTLSTYINPESAVPVCKIGSSDIYFAVTKSRPDLLTELDSALGRIQDEDAYYNQTLYDKYLINAGASLYLTADEKEWLSEHGKVRVAYQDNYLAFCAADPATGELTGALKDYLNYASTGLENVKIDFEPIAYPTASDAMAALKKGEVDCVFPANLTPYDSEAAGVIMSPALMTTAMDAVVRAAEKQSFLRQEKVTVAVNEGNSNYELFLAEHYPAWDIARFKDTPAGLDAIAAGEVDCVIISNYRYSNISKQCERLHLSTVYTGVDMDYSFALRQGDTQLYAILAKVNNTVPASVINTALTYYSTEDVKTSFADMVKDHLFIVMSVIAAILLVILLLLLRSIRAERKAREEEKQIRDLNKLAYVDALTHVKNKGSFSGFVKRLQDQLDAGEPVEYAIGVFDCDDLKRVNDHFGHEKGDEYLMNACRLICKVFQHSPVFRIGGDEFAVILQNSDFLNREILERSLVEQMQENNAGAQAPWEEIHISCGFAVYDAAEDQDVTDTVRRADKLMYENKRIGKKKA